MPGTQVIPIEVPIVMAGLFARLTGASGTRTITAAPPTVETEEEP